MSSQSPTADALAAAAQRLEINVRFLIAAFVISAFDHVITFGEEVERIWKQKFSGATVLFLIVRYVTPLQYIIIITGYTYPHWPAAVCRRFVRFEGSSAVALVSVCQVIMILRVFALYNRSYVLLAVLFTLWSVQIAVSSVGLAAGGAAELPAGLDGVCVLTGRGEVFAAIWIAPLINDSILFFLTLWRSKDYIIQLRAERSYERMFQRTLWIFIRDGTIYFLAVVLVNLFSILVFFLAPEDFKSLGGPFWQIITSTMVLRLVLNLRSVASSSDIVYQNPSLFDTTTRIVNMTIGNLGADLSLRFRDEMETTDAPETLHGDEMLLDTLPERGRITEGGV